MIIVVVYMDAIDPHSQVTIYIHKPDKIRRKKQCKRPSKTLVLKDLRRGQGGSLFIWNTLLNVAVGHVLLTRWCQKH